MLIKCRQVINGKDGLDEFHGGDDLRRGMEVQGPMTAVQLRSHQFGGATRDGNEVM